MGRSSDDAAKHRLSGGPGSVPMQHGLGDHQSGAVAHDRQRHRAGIESSAVLRLTRKTRRKVPERMATRYTNRGVNRWLAKRAAQTALWLPHSQN